MERLAGVEEARQSRYRDRSNEKGDLVFTH